MTLLFRNFLKDLAIYGTGDLLLKATALFTLPIYTRIFTPEDYGVWSFVVTTIGLLGGILILGGDSAYARYFFEARTLQDRQIVTSTWFAFLAIWSMVIALILLPLTKSLSHWSFGTGKYGLLFIMALMAAPISLMNTMCGQVLRNRFQAQLFTALNLVSSILNIGLGIIGALIWGLTGVIGSGLVVSLIMLPIRLWTVRSILRPVFSLRILRNLLSFGVPLVPMSLAYWVFTGSDRLLIGRLSNLNQLGLYTIASNATSGLALLNGALGQAWSPHAVKVYEEQPEIAPVVFGQVMTYILVGFGLLTVVITTFAREILMIISTPPFYPAAQAVGPLALGFMAYASTQITAAGISLTKKTKYFALFSWLAALLNIALNSYLVPKWGMIGASWTSAASYTFLSLSYLVTSQRLWPVFYEKRRALEAIGLALVFTIAAPLFSDFALLEGLFLKCTYCLIYVGLLFALGVLNKGIFFKIYSLLRIS